VLLDQPQHALLELGPDQPRVLGLERVDGRSQPGDAALALAALDLGPELAQVQQAELLGAFERLGQIARAPGGGDVEQGALDGRDGDAPDGRDLVGAQGPAVGDEGRAFAATRPRRRDVEPRPVVREHAPRRGSGSVGEDAVGAGGERGGDPVRVDRQRSMPDGEHAVVQADQAPVADPACDRRRAQAGRDQLPERDHARLACSDRRDRPSGG
jgi:hypothetical protein